MSTNYTLDCKWYPFEGTNGELRFIAFVLYQTESGTIEESKYQLSLPEQDEKETIAVIHIPKGRTLRKVLIAASPDWEVDVEFVFDEDDRTFTLEAGKGNA